MTSNNELQSFHDQQKIIIDQNQWDHIYQDIPLHDNPELPHQQNRPEINKNAHDQSVRSMHSDENDKQNAQNQNKQQSNMPSDQALIKPKTAVIGIDKQEQVLIRPVYFAFKVIHVALCNFLMAYYIGNFNTMLNHLPYIFNWQGPDIDLYINLINSLPQVTAAISSFFAGRLATEYGRRKFLMACALITSFGSILTIIQSTIALIIGRLIIGLSIGGWSSIGILYTIEISPSRYRGYAGITYSLLFGIGIITSMVIGYGLPANFDDMESNFWRFQLAFPIIIAGIQFIVWVFIFTDDTYMFQMMNYAQKGNIDMAKKTEKDMNKVFSRRASEEELYSLKTFVDKMKYEKSIDVCKLISSKRYRFRTWFVIFLCFCFHWTSSNGINIYSSFIIEMHNSRSTSILFTILMTTGDVIAPIFSSIFFEKVGRKRYYIQGLIGVTLSFLIFAICGYSNYFGPQKYCLILFKFIFAMSLCPVFYGKLLFQNLLLTFFLLFYIQVYPAEILPAEGMGFVGSITWIWSLTLVIVFPILINSSLGLEGTILLFALLALFNATLIAIFMKDTSGLKKHQIEDLFTKEFKQQELESPIILKKSRELKMLQDANKNRR